MDIVRFIGWWWKQRNNSEKTLTVFLVWLAFLIPNLFIFGLKGFLIFFAGVVFTVALYLLNQIRLAILGQWEKYQFEREREAERIIQRLGGTVAPEVKYGPETILEKIRARRRTKPV